MVVKNIDDKNLVPRGKVLVGEVVSDKMEKTVVVKVVRSLRHPLYEKVVRRHKKYKVHDEQNSAKIGDLVEISECRPLSKTKHMALVRILSK
jgi:small subunit ribosomal protein S17